MFSAHSRVASTEILSRVHFVDVCWASQLQSSQCKLSYLKVGDWDHLSNLQVASNIVATSLAASLDSATPSHQSKPNSFHPVSSLTKSATSLRRLHSSCRFSSHVRRIGRVCRRHFRLCRYLSRTRISTALDCLVLRLQLLCKRGISTLRGSLDSLQFAGFSFKIVLFLAAFQTKLLTGRTFAVHMLLMSIT